MKRWLILIVVCISANCGERITGPMAAVYEVPEGFRGWTVVRYSDPSCPRVSQLDGKWHVVFDMTGRLCTSSPLTSNWRRDEYFVVGDQKREVKIVGASSGGEVRNHLDGRCSVGGQREVLFHAFYVGTAEEFREAGAVRVEECVPVFQGSSTQRKSRPSP